MPIVPCAVLEIAVDYRAGFSREVGIFPRVTLTISLIVRTTGRVVEATLYSCVIIAADIGARVGIFDARTVQVALTIPVVSTVG